MLFILCPRSRENSLLLSWPGCIQLDTKAASLGFSIKKNSNRFLKAGKFTKSFPGIGSTANKGIIYYIGHLVGYYIGNIAHSTSDKKFIFQKRGSRMLISTIELT